MTVSPRIHRNCSGVRDDAGVTAGPDDAEVSRVPARSEVVQPLAADVLRRQRSILEAWLQSDDARRTAQRLVRRRQLSRVPEELLNDAWLRLESTFGRRTEPYPSLDDVASAARFGARLLDNLSRDWVRSAGRRVEVELSDTLVTLDDGHDHAERRILVEQLIGAVAERAVSSVPCPGCPSEVVAAAALEVLHLVLSGHDGAADGRSFVDQLMYEALDRLDRLDGDVERSTAARAQRKSRCSRCVMALLQSSANDLGEVAP